jgi:hypothetical protein
MIIYSKIYCMYHIPTYIIKSDKKYVDSGKVEPQRLNLVAPQYFDFGFWSSGFFKLGFCLIWREV